MRTCCLVGTINPDDPTTARVQYVHSDGNPSHILPTLDRIWSHTCAHDTTALVEALLAHPWSYLDADITAATADSATFRKPIPGVGMANVSHVDNAPEVLPLRGAFGQVDWVYLIDPAETTVAVYAAGDATTPPLTVHHLTDPPAPTEQAPTANPLGELLAAARTIGAAAGSTPWSSASPRHPTKPSSSPVRWTTSTPG